MSSILCFKKLALLTSNSIASTFLKYLPKDIALPPTHAVASIIDISGPIPSCFKISSDIWSAKCEAVILNADTSSISIFSCISRGKPFLSLKKCVCLPAQTLFSRRASSNV